MNWGAIDWAALERMRGAFLDGSAGGADYWRTAGDVESYDETFAQRIGWKWDYVLAELARRGWSPPGGELLDWGCGSGIAHRACLDHFGTGGVTRLCLWDRSPVALQFAATKARRRFPQLHVAAEECQAPALVLLSHVLTELDAAARAELLALVRRATAVIWVEPGTRAASRALIAVREELRGELSVVAPCTHGGPCGLLTPENAPHWCHHFADVPGGVFTDAHWSRFARITGIDLGTLPLSFLVLDRRAIPPVPPGAVRVIGRPRVYKAEALLLGCDAGGVAEKRLARRRLPDEFRALKKGISPALQTWQTTADEITATKPWPEP